MVKKTGVGPRDLRYGRLPRYGLNKGHGPRPEVTMGYVARIPSSISELEANLTKIHENKGHISSITVNSGGAVTLLAGTEIRVWGSL